MKIPAHWIRLTFDGVNDLYQHPLYGAHTLERIKELDEIHSNYYARVAARNAIVTEPLVYSDEIGIRIERCIDEHGCSGISY